jgi:antitoxin component of MazEF toxin-antitoxin module
VITKKVIIGPEGKLDIPDEIVNAVDWLNPGDAVEIELVNPDKIVIRPHRPSTSA